MNWYNKYLEKVILEDIIIRDPFFLIEEKKINLLFLKKMGCNLSVSFGKSKNLNFNILSIYSVLEGFGLGNKVKVKKEKIINGKKVYRLQVKLGYKKSGKFLDFFFNRIVKGLKKRYLILNSSKNIDGLINISFSNLAEIYIDDFFFFDIYEWSGYLNININFGLQYYLNNLISNIIFNLFNIDNLVKNEIFNSKG